MLYTKVVLGLPLDGPFDYIVPPQLSKKIKAGCRVWVSFGTQKMPAYVVGLSKKSGIKNLKEISEIIDQAPVLDKNMLLLSRQIADYYCCSLGQAIETALPDALRKGRLIPAKDTAPVSVGNPPAQKPILLHDLGDYRKRWELYFGHLKMALDSKKSAIVLVRDIHSALAAKEKIAASLGVPCAMLYRNQPGELAQWLDVRDKKFQVIVGTRSAVFAPLDNLGLIIIDQEEDSVYKQDQVPHYHAREVSFLRAKIDKARLILSAGAPSLEGYYLARRKKIERLILPRAKPYPQITPIEPAIFKRRNILSKYLEDAISSALNSGGKILLFINRKGFATFASCTTCKAILKCPRCSISLIFHFKENTLSCRYCNFKMSPPNICPSCNSGYIRYSGLGTEKIESEISRLFPSAKIKIIPDSREVDPGSASIFISTESVIREAGLNFDLIGVISIDNSLNRIDLRAAEKAFGLLSGLLKLTDKKMVIQTALSGHHCLRALVDKDADIFYERELKQRKQLNFPPYRHMGLVKLRQAKEEPVKKAALELFEMLNAASKDSGVKVISVNPGQPLKLRDNFYWQVLLSCASALKLVKFLKIRLKDFPHSGIIMTVDIDPV